MRYRPFGSSGTAVSALTLSLNEGDLRSGPQAAQELIFSALEAGINSYRLENANPVLAEVVGQALSHVDRKLVNVSMTLGTGDGRRGSDRDFSAEGMTGAIDRALNVSRLGFMDTILLAEPGEDELPQSSLNALKALRATQRVHFLGIDGEGDVMDAYVSTGAFDVLVTPYHVNSAWKVRTRLLAARERDMVVIVRDFFPDSLSSLKKATNATTEKRGLFGLFGGKKKAGPLADVGTFAFLHKTPGWTAEEICLAYALIDPGVASVAIRRQSDEHFASLVTVPEREMPAGMGALVEMARIQGQQAAA